MSGDALRTLAPALARLLGAIDGATLAELAEAMTPVHLARGEVLYRQKDPASGMHVLVTGRLQVRVAAEAGSAERVVANLTPGAAVGEIALFTGGARAASVVALRDSTLAHLSQSRFDAVIARYPAAATHLARFIIGRLIEAQSRGHLAGPMARTFAIVPLDPGLDGFDFARRLQLALLRYGSTALVATRVVRDRFAPSLAGQGGSHAVELEHFLDATERAHDFVLLQADSEPSPWTRKCATYAEGLLFVARASAAIEPAVTLAQAVTRLAGEPVPSCELVLVHPERAAMPGGTRRWLDHIAVRRHLHVPWESDEGFNRLARVLSGNSVAVVLGGGGARGFAHVGVVRALREAGVPIDAIGGTSFGAVMAALVAMGWDIERILESFKAAFVDERPTNDYTLPVVSLVRGEKMARSLRRYFGETLIDDLWIPFFAVSSNLSHSREEVHRSGLLWRAVRASVSLPAIFPPLIEKGELLVDGGILNNLPVDVMHESVRGRIIAVDLSVKDEFRCDREAFPSAWEYIKARLMASVRRRGHRAGMREVTLDRVVLRSTMLGSHREAQAARREADLFLSPPTQGFDLLDWDRFLDIVEVGYRHGREEVGAWVARHPEVVQHAELFDSRLQRATA